MDNIEESQVESQAFGDLTIAEELVLLLLKEDDGSIGALASNWRLWCGFTGAILLDLSFKDKIDTDLEGLKLLDSTPTGDELLDPTLAEIAAESSVRTTRYWIEHLAPRTDAFVDNVLERLEARGILSQDSAGFWSLNTTTNGSDASHTHEELNQQVRQRIRRAIVGDELPDPHDVVLIGLLKSFDGFKSILTVDEQETAEDRIELLAGLDLFGQAILSSINSMYEPPSSMLQRRFSDIPEVRLWDCLRSKSFRQKNLPKFFAEQVEKLGPVFRFNVPGSKAIVIGGQEMNQWVGRRGRLYLRTRDYIEDLQQAWGTARSIASMDGAEHYRMRRAVRGGNSRVIVEQRLDEVYALSRDVFDIWKVGEILPGEMTMQRYIGRLIARLTVNVEPSFDVLDGLLKYEFRALLVYVMGVLPAFTLRTPNMKKAHAAVLEVYRQIHSTHTPGQRENMPPDLVDDLTALHQSDPQFLPSTDLEFAFIAPLIAGHYTGSAMSFSLYHLFKNPEALKRVTEEADKLFSGGDPSFEDLSMENIDYTHRVVMEVLRINPVIPLHFRMTMNTFEVGNYQIPERSELMVAFPATHFMDEFFKDPDKFDPDRFSAPRVEHRTPGVYNPFGLGTHACLGSRFTELLMVVCLLLVTHHLEFEMVPKNYQLKYSPLPKYSPDKGFKFRLKGIRNPFK